MSLLTSLTSAFKGGGAAARVPMARGFVSPWATAFASPALPAFDYANAVAEAYLANPVAQRSVRLVAEGVGSAPLLCPDERLAKLIAGSCGSQPLLEVLAAQLVLHGNAFVQIVTDATGMPAELYPLRPERVAVVAGEDGWPTAYRYTLPGRTLTLPARDGESWPALLHLPMLLGLPGDATYANYREANRALWRLTLLPLAQSILTGLHSGLGEWFAAPPRVDLDRIPALAEDREKLWAQVSGADFLSAAEKRALLGLTAAEPAA